MKKILILNYEYPPLGGGAGVVSQKYAKGLADLGNRVVVITTFFPGQKEIQEEGNLTIIRLKSLRKKEFQSNPIEMLSYVFTAIKFLDEYIKDNTFDLSIGFFAIPGSIVSKHIFSKFGIPYIISTHGQDIPGFYPRQMRKYHILTNRYTRMIRQKSQKILFLTSKMQELAIKFAPKMQDKFILLPNGCDSDFFSPDFSKRGNKFKLIFVGRLVGQKDPFTMLKAIKLLHSKNNNFSLDIIGDGPLRASMQKFVRENGLQKNVNFLGWISKDELKGYYQSAHIQICSAHIEAMSVGILESLYSGVYVLSTPVSGNTDMITEKINGEFFEIGDYNILASKLMYWIDNFEKLPFDMENLENLKQKFNRDNIIYKLNQIIND